MWQSEKGLQFWNDWESFDGLWNAKKDSAHCDREDRTLNKLIDRSLPRLVSSNHMLPIPGVSVRLLVHSKSWLTFKRDDFRLLLFFFETRLVLLVVFHLRDRANSNGWNQIKYERFTTRFRSEACLSTCGRSNAASGEKGHNTGHSDTFWPLSRFVDRTAGISAVWTVIENSIQNPKGLEMLSNRPLATGSSLGNVSQEAVDSIIGLTRYDECQLETEGSNPYRFAKYSAFILTYLQSMYTRIMLQGTESVADEMDILPGSPVNHEEQEDQRQLFS